MVRSYLICPLNLYHNVNHLWPHYNLKLIFLFLFFMAPPTPFFRPGVVFFVDVNFLRHFFLGGWVCRLSLGFFKLSISSSIFLTFSLTLLGFSSLFFPKIFFLSSKHKISWIHVITIKHWVLSLYREYVRVFFFLRPIQSLFLSYFDYFSHKYLLLWEIPKFLTISILLDLN